MLATRAAVRTDDPAALRLPLRASPDGALLPEGRSRDFMCGSLLAARGFSGSKVADGAKPQLDGRMLADVCKLAKLPGRSRWQPTAPGRYGVSTGVAAS